jgi:hypothetical protein
MCLLAINIKIANKGYLFKVVNYFTGILRELMVYREIGLSMKFNKPINKCILIYQLLQCNFKCKIMLVLELFKACALQ